MVKQTKTKNKIGDLNNHLFEQLERLNDEDLSVEDLNKEIKRSKAMANIAMSILASGTLLLKAKKYTDEFGEEDMPEVLQISNK